MPRYSDKIADQYGAPIPGATVYVYDQNEALATLTEDGGGALDNPVTSDEYGGFHFNAEDGLYDLAFHYGGKEIRWINRVVVGVGPELPAEIIAALIQPGAADFIGFLPAGTGAVATTVQQALRAIGAVGALSTTAQLQTALDYIATNGGTLIIPPGTYAITGQLTLTPTTLYGIHILGYGAEFTTTGTNSGLKIESAYWLPAQIVVEGLKVNHRGNATAKAGFELEHSNHVTFRNCEVEAHGTSADYGAFWFHHDDPTNPDAGCFWNTLDGCTVRPRDGSDGSIAYGVKLSGVANATTVTHCAFSGVVTGVYMAPEAGQTAMSNSIVIDDVKFETVTTAIHVNAAAAVPIAGLRVVNCRAEALTTFLSLTGATAQPAVPPYLAGNYLTPGISTYINNPNNLYVNTPGEKYNEGMELAMANRMLMRNVSGSGHTLDLWASATGQVVQQWNNDAGALLASLTWVTDANTSLIELTGSNASLCVTGIAGISQTTTRARNLRGTATFAAGTTVAVSFPVAEADANYTVQLTPKADPVGRLWTSGLGTGGFTINNSSSTSIAVDWLIVR
jgi:hypothetical protein